MMRASILWAGIFFAATTACSSSDDAPAGPVADSGSESGSDSDTPVTADQACDQYVDALCGKVGSCLGVYVDLAFGDAATCKTRFKPKCLDAFKTTGSSGKPVDLVACAEAAKGASCEALFDNDPPAACIPKKGSVANGSPCGDDGQCSSGFCGYDDGKRSCGVCGGAPAAGATCVDGKKCGPGFICAKNGKCSAPVADGATCDDGIPCRSGLDCLGGKCQKRVTTAGAACGGTNPDCDATASLFCIANKCLKADLADKGAACGFDVDTTTMPASIKKATLCKGGAWCKGVDASKSVFKGTCTAGAADGEACQTDSVDKTAPPCLAPALCISNKCVYPLPSSCK